MSPLLLPSVSVSTGAVARRGQVLMAMQHVCSTAPNRQTCSQQTDVQASLNDKMFVKKLKKKAKSNQDLVDFDDYSRPTLLCFKYCRNQVKDISVVTCNRQK